MPVVFSFAARSDIGLTRANNQDSGYAGPHLLVVADGMGGHAGGDIASSVAIAHLAALDEETPAADEAAQAIHEAVAAAHSELLERVEEDPELAGLGTTITALLRCEDRLVLAHIGDSRAYLLREGTLEQVTVDHTFVQYLVETGRLDPDQAERHPQRSLLLRVLGDVELGGGVDVAARSAQVGDRWMLCSDGLSSVVSPETLSETLTQEKQPAVAADKLIDLALRAGGPDNITCVVADVLDLDKVADGRAPSSSVQVVGAAAVDRNRPTRGGSGAAGKAAALTAPKERTPDAAVKGKKRRRRKAKSPADDEESDTPRPRSLARRLVIPVIAVIVLGACIAVGKVAHDWSQTQYYLGVSQGKVAVYQGINQTLGPLHLSHVIRETDVAVASLDQVYQDRIGETISAGSLAEAEDKLAEFLTGAQTDSAAHPPEAP
ncbi:MAG: protein phosphatase 2C domain-containing protein [Micrococcales bacterium]|nr:protein phosphatase 2C domain-containing protein [Micrococcales bacterium]